MNELCIVEVMKIFSDFILIIPLIHRLMSWASSAELDSIRNKKDLLSGNKRRHCTTCYHEGKKVVSIYCIVPVEEFEYNFFFNNEDFLEPNISNEKK